MIFQLQNEPLIYLFRCPVCSKIFGRVGPEPRSSFHIDCPCHGPGTCCHHNEREFPEDRALAAVADLDQWRRRPNGDQAWERIPAERA